MGDPVRRRGEWWQQQPGGSWLKWRESDSRWEPQEFPPPPPEDRELAETPAAATPAPVDAAVSSGMTDTPAPAPGYKYARSDDGTWWARDERTGDLHWHDAAAGQWRRYVDPSRSRGATRILEGVEYAGFWRRLAAMLIDSVLILAVAGLPLWAALAGGDFPSATPEEQTAMGLVLQLVGAVGAWLYDALMESSSKQATLGKMALGLRVTDLDGNRVGFGKATGRHFGKYISYFILGIGFLMVAWTRQKQGLHDQMAGTLVLKGRPADAAADAG